MGDVFEWYPKLNDTHIKEYLINFRLKNNNKIYSNLDEVNSNQSLRFQGKDNEIIFVSGNISKRKYKGTIFIGNEEIINNNLLCDEALSNANGIKKIIYVPEIAGGGKTTKGYINANVISN